MGIVVVLLVLSPLLAIAAWVDWRGRRHGHRARPGHEVAALLPAPDINVSGMGS